MLQVCDDKSMLHLHHSQSDFRNCTHCCHGDLCNVKGCNQTGESAKPPMYVFTCVALGKAGLVVGPIRPSARLSVRLSVRLLVCLQHFGVPSLCNI